jgi:hypothetical protein
VATLKALGAVRGGNPGGFIFCKEFKTRLNVYGHWVPDAGKGWVDDLAPIGPRSRRECNEVLTRQSAAYTPLTENKDLNKKKALTTPKS